MSIRMLIATAVAAFLLTACTMQSPLPDEGASAALMANVSVGFLGLREPVARRPAMASTTARLILCVRELRFYSKPGQKPVVVELSDGEIDVSRDSYEFATVKVPPGRYEALGLQLSPRCQGASALVQNQYGRFPLRASKEVVWLSGLDVGNRMTRLWLPVRPLLKGAAEITDASQVAAFLDRTLR